MISHLLAKGNGVVRPRDAAALYFNPSKEFARLSESGVLLKLSGGYYAIVPEEHRLGFWRPTIEGIALGMAVADYGREGAALMGVSAARAHGAMQRATSVGVVATAHQRPTKTMDVGRVVFVKREIESIDVQVVKTDLVTGLATTIEQTALDIADRPELGGTTPATATEVLTELAGNLRWDVVVELAENQRKTSAVVRLAWVASAVIDPPKVPRPRGLVDGKGLRPVGALPAAEFRIQP